MRSVGIILARAGSKGLPDKCVLPLCGKPVVGWTIEHAQAARRLEAVVLTTDSAAAQAIGRTAGLLVLDRPAELAGDTARVDDVVRHAVAWYEASAGPVDAVAILYGNIPVRAAGVIDRCLERLESSGCDSVRSVAPVTKQHPDWIHRLDGDVMGQFRPNSIHRRQELEPLYYHDGAVVAVTRASLFAAAGSRDPHAFFGADRRAVVQAEDDAVDIDCRADLCRAEALLRARGHGGSGQAAGAQWPSFRIGPTLIGPGEPVYIVAEIGVNHDGSLAVARELVRAAAQTGVDAVKFQVFSPERLVRRDAPAAAYQQEHAGATSQHELLSRLAMPPDAFAELAELAAQCGVEFLATPFSVPDLDFLVKLGVRALKLASTDIVNRPLLAAAVASRLPLMVSRGAADGDEIAAAVEFVGRQAGGPLALLHCVSSYPTPEWEANLRAIGTLAGRFGCVCGFSDHTESVTIGGYAAAAGACILEKHMTLDRSASGPDHSFSLTPAMMAEYVRNTRQAEMLLGNGRLAVSPCEAEVRRLSRGSVVAARDLSPGEVLTLEMLTVKRPGDGIAPTQLDLLVGRRVNQSVPADSPLSWDALC